MAKHFFGTIAFEMTLLDAVNPKAIEPPQNRHKGQGTKNFECDRLVERRQHIKMQHCSGFIPDSVVVTRDHTELIGSRIEVGVESLPACSCILPLFVLPLKLVAKANPLGDGETSSRIAYLQIRDSRRQLQEG